MEDIIKEYSKDDVTVVWQPKKCIHSANCWRGLPKAFNPKEKPWITLDNVTSEEIMEQVLKCPSGALSIKNAASDATDTTAAQTNAEIVVLKMVP